MNKIDAIVIHCSATRAGQDIGKKEITLCGKVGRYGRGWPFAHH